MGFPAREARAFPGNRDEANRAGITPRIRVRTSECIIADYYATDLKSPISSFCRHSRRRVASVGRCQKGAGALSFWRSRMFLLRPCTLGDGLLRRLASSAPRRYYDDAACLDVSQGR